MIHTLVATMVAAMSVAATHLEMDETFTVKNNGTEVWAITPGMDGTMKIVGDVDDYIGSCLVVYDNEEMTHEVQHYNWTCYEVQVTAGHTYYIKTWNDTGQDWRGRCVMGGEFKFEGATPEAGGVFRIVGDCEARLHFSSPNVRFKSGTLACNGHTVNIYYYNDFNELVSSGIFTYSEAGTSGMANYNGAVLGHTDNDGIAIPFITQTGTEQINVIYTMLEKGDIHTGDVMTLTLTGVQNMLTGALLPAADASLQDGEVTVSWTVGDMPTTLVGANLPETFLSYWVEDEDGGIAAWTFSREIRSANLSIGMGYADADDRYEAELPVTVEGNTVKADLRGTLRTAATMGLTTTYPQMELLLYYVVDIDGNLTYAGDQGREASYAYNLPYDDISTTVSYDITPGDGAQLTDETRAIEIWVETNDVIVIDGVSLSYKRDGVPVERHLALDDEGVTCEIDDYGTTVTLAVTDEMRRALDVNVALSIAKSRDGLPHTIQATYNPDPDGIGRVTGTNDGVAYTLGGQRVPAGYKGVRIVKNNKSL